MVQIRQSKVGTAVDQWGWDSKEMWLPFLKDEELMDNLATFWARPLAMGYLPPQYRADLAGGRLIALSKHPKECIRPICITDALRRLVAKGLYKCCKGSFAFVFEEQHPRAIQFGANLKDGAAHMFHLVQGIFEESLKVSPESPDDDEPLAFAVFDVRNAFNELSRAQLASVFENGCPSAYNSNPSSPTDSQPGTQQGNEALRYDILWPHVQSHYGAKGSLKFYHNGVAYRIPSSKGVLQARGDPQSSPLFALALHPLLIQTVQEVPNLLAPAYADST